MRISIIGSGYVGLVTGIGFVELGNEVIFVDTDISKVDAINDLKPPIYEKGLEELMKKNKDKFYATSDYNEAISNTEITFICVGTPSQENGSIDLRYIKSAARSIGKALSNKRGFHVIVVKSTVIPGTTEEFVRPLIEKESKKNSL